MPRKIKNIWVIAKEGSPVIQPNGEWIYHHHPIQIPDSTWARKRFRKGELTHCKDVETRVIKPGDQKNPIPLPPEDIPVTALSLMKDMIKEGVNLTATGKPELPVLKEKLEAAGLELIDMKKRDELFAQISRED